MVSFRDKPLVERKIEVEKILKRYPDKIPVVLIKNNSAHIPNIDKEKFLVPNTMTVGEFIYMIRKRIILESHQAIFIFFNNNLVNTSALMSEIYMNYKNKDDEMLYASYSGENTFG
jgi:GABA(A) receptor-associated protein